VQHKALFLKGARRCEPIREKTVFDSFVLRIISGGLGSGKIS